MEEIWKPVNGYEGIYEVSNYGRVKSLSRDVKSCYGCTGHRRERMKSIQKDRFGYMVVQLYRNGRLKTNKVHRLVASSFIPNPNGLPCVNHKDENKANNRVDNLEWCTYKYNSNYGTGISRCSQKNKKKVAKYDKEGNLLAIYDSITEAAKANGLWMNGISQCSLGRKNYSNCGGYIWKRITKK